MLVCHFGTFSDFLSTVSVNCFSTHLLTTENHKPAVMLRVLCVAYKRAYGPFVKFAHRCSSAFSHCISPLYFSLTISHNLYPNYLNTWKRLNQIWNLGHVKSERVKKWLKNFSRVFVIQSVVFCLEFSAASGHHHQGCNVARFEKFSLNFSVLLFVIHVNLLYP